MNLSSKQNIILALGIGLFVFSACQGTISQHTNTTLDSNQKEPISLLDQVTQDCTLPALPLDTLVEDSCIILEDNEHSPKLDYLFQYIYPKGSKNLLYHYNKAILGDKFARVQPENLLREYREQVLKDYQTDDSYSSEEYVHRLSVDKVFGTDQFVSVTWGWATYEGGAHGNKARGCASFDVKTGQQITESDIFRSDAKEDLGKVIQSALMKMYKVSTIETLEEQGFFSPKEIVPNGNFMLIKDGVYYCFQPYEIASFANGIIEVSLSWEEIAPFVRPHSLIERYI